MFREGIPPAMRWNLIFGALSVSFVRMMRWRFLRVTIFRRNATTISAFKIIRGEIDKPKYVDMRILRCCEVASSRIARGMIPRLLRYATFYCVWPLNGVICWFSSIRKNFSAKRYALCCFQLPHFLIYFHYIHLTMKYNNEIHCKCHK